MGNRVGGAYSFNYDLKQDTFLQQRLTAYYNSQCCGIAAEYQTFNYARQFRVTAASPRITGSTCPSRWQAWGRFQICSAPLEDSRAANGRIILSDWSRQDG